MNNYIRNITRIKTLNTVNIANKINTRNTIKNNLILVLIVLTMVITIFIGLGFTSRVFANMPNQSTSILDTNNNIEEGINKQDKVTYTSTTVDSITSSMSDETLSFTNLLLIVLISINIVLLLLAIIILMQMNKKL